MVTGAAVLNRCHCWVEESSQMQIAPAIVQTRRRNRIICSTETVPPAGHNKHLVATVRTQATNRPICHRRCRPALAATRPTNPRVFPSTTAPKPCQTALPMVSAHTCWKVKLAHTGRCQQVPAEVETKTQGTQPVPVRLMSSGGKYSG